MLICYYEQKSLYGGMKKFEKVDEEFLFIP